MAVGVTEVPLIHKGGLHPFRVPAIRTFHLGECVYFIVRCPILRVALGPTLGRAIVTLGSGYSVFLFTELGAASVALEKDAGDRLAMFSSMVYLNPMFTLAPLTASRALVTAIYKVLERVLAHAVVDPTAGFGALTPGPLLSDPPTVSYNNALCRLECDGYTL